MGYAKNPGGFWDIVGLIIVGILIIEGVIAFICYLAGDMGYFVELHKVWFGIAKSIFGGNAT